MESKSWIIPSKSRRDDALYELEREGFRVGRFDNLAAVHQLNVTADEEDWDHVTRIVERLAPGAQLNKPE